MADINAIEVVRQLSELFRAMHELFERAVSCATMPPVRPEPEPEQPAAGECKPRGGVTPRGRQTCVMGSYVRHLLRRAKKTQGLVTDKALAGYVGVHPSAISQWQCGRAKPCEVHLDRLRNLGRISGKAKPRKADQPV